MNARAHTPIRNTKQAAELRDCGEQGSRSTVRDVAFSLIEIMITVALLSLIVLGLLSMFTQTKRAFTSSMTQSDVMEAGRAMMAGFTRELEQMTPTHAPPINNGNYVSTNFFAETSPGFDKDRMYQPLPGSLEERTNVVQRFFFVTQQNQDWIGTGYQVLLDDPATGVGVGTLFRASSTVSSRGAAILLSSNFLYSFGPSAPVTNLNRIADGVVHLRVRAFATNGFPITPDGFALGPGVKPAYANVANTRRFWNLQTSDQVESYFFSNAVPAYVEVELGILEPRVVDRFRSMSGNATAQRQYLSNHVAQVHLFRQRIAIRNVDFSPYQ